MTATPDTLRAALDAHEYVAMPFERRIGCKCGKWSDDEPAPVGEDWYSLPWKMWADHREAAVRAALPRWPEPSDEAVAELADELGVYMGTLRAREAARAILLALRDREAGRG